MSAFGQLEVFVRKRGFLVSLSRLVHESPTRISREDENSWLDDPRETDMQTLSFWVSDVQGRKVRQSQTSVLAQGFS